MATPQNLESWEAVKREVDRIEPHPNQPPAAAAAEAPATAQDKEPS